MDSPKLDPRNREVLYQEILNLQQIVTNLGGQVDKELLVSAKSTNEDVEEYHAKIKAELEVLSKVQSEQAKQTGLNQLPRDSVALLASMQKEFEMQLANKQTAAQMADLRIGNSKAQGAGDQQALPHPRKHNEARKLPKQQHEQSPKTPYVSTQNTQYIHNPSWARAGSSSFNRPIAGSFATLFDDSHCFATERPCDSPHVHMHPNPFEEAPRKLTGSHHPGFWHIGRKPNKVATLYAPETGTTEEHLFEVNVVLHRCGLLDAKWFQFFLRTLGLAGLAWVMQENLQYFRKSWGR